MKNYFNVITKNLKNSNKLSFINIEEIDNKLKECIDNNLVQICEGNSSANLQYVKKRLSSFLLTKRGSTTEMGAIAEFLIHLYLNDRGFEPQFLYLNLEENSIKKGFDGYYQFANEEWIVESKSGSSISKDVSHIKKIKESYDDLKGKLLGASTNNPWRNAYNHASHGDVRASSDLLKKIKAFTEQYDRNIFYDIKTFNIIPGSTIFLDGTWQNPDVTNLQIEIEKMILKFQFKKIEIICITKKTLDLFIDYLKIIP